jgi:acyl-CoA thioesterase YciA
MDDNVRPKGELVISTVAMPMNTNAYGDIFGGWLISQMDIGASILAHQRALNRVTTVAIDSMVFLAPVQVGDTLRCYASVKHTGRSSIAIQIEAWSCCRTNNQLKKVTEGVFTFVAINEEGHPMGIDWVKTAKSTQGK